MESNEIEDPTDENWFGLVGDFLEWMMETDVNLAVALLLLLVGYVPMALRAYFKWRIAK